MDDTHLPPGDESAGHPTEQFWPTAGSPGPAASGPAAPGRDGATDPQHDSRGRHRALRWSAGIATAVLVAGGGIIAGVSLAGGKPPTVTSSPAAASAPAAASPAPAPDGPHGQAAVLSATLNSAGSPVAGSLNYSAAATVRRCLAARAAARATAAQAARRACRRAALRRLALRGLALRGLHGEFTFRSRDGVRTLAFERGVIQSVSSGHNLVIRAADGTTWTWDLLPSTVVRQHGRKTGTGALAAGEHVWAGGRVRAGAKDARLLVIRPLSASPAPAPS